MLSALCFLSIPTVLQHQTYPSGGNRGRGGRPVPAEGERPVRNVPAQKHPQGESQRVS